jgi:hypothetical protein
MPLYPVTDLISEQMVNVEPESVVMLARLPNLDVDGNLITPNVDAKLAHAFHPAARTAQPELDEFFVQVIMLPLWFQPVPINVHDVPHTAGRAFCQL